MIPVLSRAALAAFAIAFAGMIQARPTLEAELRRIAAEAPGTLGVRVVHLESGEGASVNPAGCLPTMTYDNLPIAIQAVTLAERAQLNLKSTLTLGSPDRRPGFSPLARTIEDKGPQPISIGAMA